MRHFTHPRLLKALKRLTFLYRLRKLGWGVSLVNADGYIAVADPLLPIHKAQ